MTWKKHEVEGAREALRSSLRPGDSIYTVLRHVSRSGMYRAIDLYLWRVDGAGQPYPLWLSRYAAKALDCRFDEKYEAIGIGGCGMDMGNALVSDLSHALFQNGNSLKHMWL